MDAGAADIHSFIYIMMLGANAPDFDAYGLFRATHSHFSASVRAKHVPLAHSTLASFYLRLWNVI